jgi:hypothetical protein
VIYDLLESKSIFDVYLISNSICEQLRDFYISNARFYIEISALATYCR